MTTMQLTAAYRAPLALRAVDSATGADVGDGLLALAWREGEPAAARRARRSRMSALLGFGPLPGLYGQEFATAAGGAAPDWPGIGPRPFVVTVTDTFGRYLPEVLAVEAPRISPLDVIL